MNFILMAAVFLVSDWFSNKKPLPANATYAELGAVRLLIDQNSFGIVGNDVVFDVRLKFTDGAILSETFVDIEGSPLGHQPIHLAVFTSSATDCLVTAPFDAVSIVRWRAGESEIWVRISQPSSDWVEVSGVSSPPTIVCNVSWSIGLGEPVNTGFLLPKFLQSLSNLSGNSRNGIDPIALPIQVNTIGLPESARIELATTWMINSQGVTTAASTAGIVLGDQIHMGASKSSCMNAGLLLGVIDSSFE
ncbi:MAG: hypothetical protein KDC35_04420 [Acidobacteria bacterium]|nr:hypothetical protein [Acidobacteriota bacterium]